LTAIATPYDEAVQQNLGTACKFYRTPRTAGPFPEDALINAQANYRPPSSARCWRRRRWPMDPSAPSRRWLLRVLANCSPNLPHSESNLALT
jgi:hypothetical protein